MKTRGSRYCLTGTSAMMGRGNATPATPAQVVSAHTPRRYNSWSTVKRTTTRYGTSCKETHNRRAAVCNECKMRFVPLAGDKCVCVCATLGRKVFRTGKVLL